MWTKKAIMNLFKVPKNQRERIMWTLMKSSVEMTEVSSLIDNFNCKFTAN